MRYELSLTKPTNVIKNTVCVCNSYFYVLIKFGPSITTLGKQCGKCLV